MAQPYVGEIRMFAGNFAPAGWMFCDGQLLAISENETLFQLIGTTYGGDGQSTFALPDLRGRVPIHQGNGFILAETGGAEEITLTVQQIPSHVHVPAANSGNASSTDPANNFWAAQTSLLQYSGPGTANTNLAANTLAATGGNQPHTNFQPYLCVDFIISLFGIFPSQT
ncbi:phage tail protein [Terrimonas alba]|uniref:phage tail protein n=1 Tax=Terrimonas alba TaxID=3349636 RepID=UPI0035F35993